MYSLFGSKTKSDIITYLLNNPHKTAKQISQETKINYKNTHKILNELLDEQIISKKQRSYYLKSQFIESLKKVSDSGLKNYTDYLVIKNNLDLYNTLISLYPEENIKNDVDELIENWLVKKLDDWYSKNYDLENKEYEKIKEIILNRFQTKKLKILEIGSGTGRLASKLAKDFEKVKGIDLEEKYIKYCEKKHKRKNLQFENANIEKYEDKEKYDVILFSWMGLHYQKNIDKIIHNTKKLIKKQGLILIIDAYYETEYIKILQLIREENLGEIKLLKENLNQKLISEFKNLKQEILLTKYTFKDIQEVINNFKIELTLEESRIWTKEDEEKLKKHLLKKKQPLIIGEGLWITKINT